VAAGDSVYRDRPEPGRWIYEVSTCAVSGKEGPSCRVGVDFPPPPATPAAVRWALTARPAEAKQTGQVAYGVEGAVFSGGYLTLPHRDELNMENGLAVRFEFRAERVDAMPVLLSHGLWQCDGWFVQILDSRLIIRTPYGDGVGPVIQPGVWYAVRWEFDGMRQRLQVNGKWIPQARETHGGSLALPAQRALVVGQYETKEPSFAFYGRLRNLSISDEPEPEVDTNK
jgi:hypothetical protein